MSKHHVAMALEKPKRFRANSISGRLRSLSELIEEGMIESRQKGVLKDMIIAEDPRVTNSITEYHDHGNPEPIQVLLRDGFLNRKSSLDVLGDPTDISFDFFHVTGLSSSVNSDTSLHEELDIEFHLQDYTDAKGGPLSESIIISLQRQRPDRHRTTSDLQSSFNSPPPELFGGIFDEQPVRSGAFAPGARLHRDSIAALDDMMDVSMPPPRAHSLPPLPPPSSSSASRSSGRNVPVSNESPPHQHQPHHNHHHHQQQQQQQQQQKKQSSAPIAIPPRTVKPAPRMPRAPKPPAVTVPSGSAFADDYSQLRSTEGVELVGAYSPEARKARVARFVEKRERRVWRKKVKYDVRKNFADSRLRVKGRFVRKEDESMLRDLMSMT